MGRPVAVGGEERFRALRFVGRVYRLRALGLGLGFFCVASVLRLDMAPLGWWVALAVNAYLWPHVAYLLARHDQDPQRAEMRNLMVDSDTPARYGGDEFLVVLPETTLVNAAGIAERIRVQFRAFMHESIPDANCTASFGAAEASSTMSDGENWVHEADAALYDAKTGGRDRYVGAPVPPPSPEPESA